MSIPRIPDGLCIKVLVMDEDSMTAHLLTADLKRHDQFHVMRCTPNFDSISECLAEDSSPILLVGTKSREAAFNGMSLLKRIRNRYPNTRAIVLLDDSAADLVAELFRAGVKGVFNRSEYDLQRLCRCIFCVSSGQIWANSEQLGFVMNVFAETASLNVLNSSGEEMLTKREKDVVRLVAEGFGNREIAQQLGLSVHTVKNYLFNVFDKLGISSRAELVMYVLSNSDNTLPRADDKDQSAALQDSMTSDKAIQVSQPQSSRRPLKKIAC